MCSRFVNFKTWPPCRHTQIVEPLVECHDDPAKAEDCFYTVFVSRLLEGWNLEKTALFANAVRALSTIKKGSMEGAPILDEAMKFMRVSTS
jgi:hypothetical protein